MEQIQIVGMSPQDFNTLISEGIKNQLQDLKEHFQPKEPTEYLSRKQVSQLLQVDLSTIHNWSKAGKLKPYGIGNRVYFKRHEIEHALIQLNK